MYIVYIYIFTPTQGVKQSSRTSPDLEFYASMCCDYHELVGIGEKSGFCVLQIGEYDSTNRAVFVQQACGLLAVPTPCAYLTQLRMLDLNAGKGHQVMKSIQLCTYTALHWSASMMAIPHYNG